MPNFKRVIAAFKSGQLTPPPVAQLIGIHLTNLDEGTARMELDANEKHWNPMGTLHGGIICDLADAAMGMAFATTLDENQSFTTIELKVNFLRPIVRARLIADGKVTARGRTIGLVECEILDERGRLIAKAASTCMALRRDKQS